MGLKKDYLDFMNSNISKVYTDVKNLKMLELGDQLILPDDGIDELTGKEYFTNLGYDHISVDINGLHGALVKDLTKEEDFSQWNNYFDVITNAGTTEHVEPFEKQFTCYKILHECAKLGAAIVHLVPDVKVRDETGAWFRHCKFYYSSEFFEMLASENGYEILENTVINGHRSVALKKLTDCPFMSDSEKFLSFVAKRNFTKEHFIPK